MRDSKPPDIPEQHRPIRPGNWLPEDHRVHRAWLQQTVKDSDSTPKDFHPEIQEMKELIENDTRMRLLVETMFSQISSKKVYQQNPAGERQVRDYQHMLELMNHLMTTAPSYSEKENQVGLVGLPFHAIFDWPMGTASGFAVFLDLQFNAALKKILDAWGRFLMTEASADVLGDGLSGWLGPVGKKDLTQTANLATGTRRTFEETYECDPEKKNHGFTSWDDFFTRKYKEGVRPVASPDDDDIISNACESQPYKVAHNVEAHAKFWIKGQPYSITDMLAHHALAPHFVGGTIYQAFLSALSYHRWHAPVTGRIVSIHLVPGTYFSEPPFTGFQDAEGIAMDGVNSGQEYLTALATRALIFIEADNAAIGLMCVSMIGMVEVSTCDVTVKEGQQVAKGEELGMFHYGGSSHCLLFREGVNVMGFPDTGRTTNVPVRSKVGHVVRKT
ncbi:Phophatidylserine decarboxylase-domain-containing protein [Calycina marina]|uniref:Phophatidylserine decarboxylase-domain-containing protein n=1 Tax=Calycina marina TaxID=1763456 RepID=A0A9P8CHV8_9HELO|nr:Phophatidylserine decarboxylase-domain-containing protein [Calycina marina]